MGQWPLFRFLSGTIQTSEASATASASRIFGEPPASSSSRFSTVVDREETRMIIDIDDDDDEDQSGREVEDTSEDEVASEDDVDSESIIPLGLPPPTLSEPPFLTDGRGRVVWSSSAANKAIGHVITVEHTDHTSPPSSHSTATVAPYPSTPPPSAPVNQLLEVSRVLPNDGFTTDGRGRVINIGSNDEEVFQPAPAPPRSFLGRMFDALF
jgi:hypothetical protein